MRGRSAPHGPRPHRLSEQCVCVCDVREQIVSDREQQQQRLQDLTVLIEGRNQQKMNAIRTLYDTELDQYEDDDDEDMVVRPRTTLRCVCVRLEL